MGRGEFIGLLQNQFCQFTKSEVRMTMLITLPINLIKKSLRTQGKNKMPTQERYSSRMLLKI
jgi:hypothetical protein